MTDPLAPRLRLRSDLEVFVVDGEGSYLVSENGLSFIEGELSAMLLPLIDGTRTRDQIAAACTGAFGADEVQGALFELEAGGAVFADRAGSEHSLADAGLYESRGVSAIDAASLLGDATITVVVIGDVDASPVEAMLLSSGVGEVQLAHGPAAPRASTLVVAVTDSYLRPELHDVNAAALATSQPWLLARPVGVAKWIGPLFRPPETACWECLAHRLRINRHEESYLQEQLGRTAPVNVVPGRHRLSDELGATLAALEALKVVTGIGEETSAIVTFDVASLETERHHVSRRPQCAACGDATIVARQALQPVQFESRPKATTSDGGHRALPPETMVERFLAQVSPISGVVTELRRSALPVDGLHVYTAGQNIASMPSEIIAPHVGLRSMSSGKGMSEAQAKASALGEAIERSSTMFHGDESRRTTSFVQLGDDAIDPNEFLLFSERQYVHREIWNLGASQFNRVFEPFDPEAVMDWSPVWSVTHQSTRWLPSQLVYFAYPAMPGGWLAFADSNGCAAGTSREDATLQGFCELVERDSVALWWYNRVARPAIDLSGFDDPYISRLLTIYAGLGREVWALDLTSDLGIPAIGAFSRVVDGPQEDILIAFGAHLDPEVALLRALGEMNQFIAGVHPTIVNGHEIPQFDDPTFRLWCETATLANQPYLSPDPEAAPRGSAAWPNLSSDDLAEDLRSCQRRVEDAGLELLVVDLTRPDVRLPVVKVVVPGLRHFWPRYAPGRLYDVPVKLGWVTAPTPEELLNPFPIFI